MTTAITTLRSTVAAALANVGVWSTFAYPPSTILANSVVVAPADPYISPSNNSYASISPMANLKVIMTVPMFSNEGNLQGIEDTIVAVFNKLASSAIVFNVTAVSAPSVLSVASGDLLTADLQISILTSWTQENKMAWSEEDLAFFKRTGQEVPKQNEEPKQDKPTKEKVEEQAVSVFLSNGVQVTLNSVVLTTNTTSATINRSFDELEVTAMGDTAHKFVKGLEASTITLDFLNDDSSTGAGSVRTALQSAWGTTVPLTLKQTSAVVSATNPLYSTTVLVNNTTDINGAVADIGTQSITFTCNSPIVITTAP